MKKYTHNFYNEKTPQGSEIMADKEEDKKEIVDQKNRAKKMKQAFIAAAVAAAGVGGYTTYNEVFAPAIGWDAVQNGEIDSAIAYLPYIEEGRDMRHYTDEIFRYFERRVVAIPQAQLSALLEQTTSIDHHARMLQHSVRVNDSASVRFILENSPFADEISNSAYTGSFGYAGRLDVLQAIHAHRPLSDEVVADTFLKAAIGNHLNVLEWLNETFTVDTTRTAEAYPYFFLSQGIALRNDGQGEISIGLRDRYSSTSNAEYMERRTQTREYLLPMLTLSNSNIVERVARNIEYFDAEGLDILIGERDFSDEEQRRLLLASLEKPDLFEYFSNRYTYAEADYQRALEVYIETNRRNPEILGKILAVYTPDSQYIESVFLAAHQRGENSLINQLGGHFDVPDAIGHDVFLTAVRNGRISDAMRALANIDDIDVKTEAFLIAAQRGHIDMLWSFQQFGMEIAPDAPQRAFLAALEEREYDTMLHLNERYTIPQETITQTIQLLVFDGNIRMARQLERLPAAPSPQTPRP